MTVRFLLARALFARLRTTRSGVAMTEFALAAPLMLTAALYGTEEVNYSIANMKVGQLAVQLADNASRIGDTSTLQNRKIYESDIDDLIYGAQLQAGGLNFFGHGRAVISSLEVLASSNHQYIHWQRCRGAKVANSSYGAQGAGTTSTIPGMGPAGAEVTADPGDAVIFVELYYDYQPIIPSSFFPLKTIHSIASFNVRDSRDLSQIYQRDSAHPDQVQDCSAYLGSPALTTTGKLS